MPHNDEQQLNDEKVRNTNDEATLCKYTLVQRKYIEDPFVQLFLQNQSQIPRIAPLINRGYFARVYSINRLLNDFVAMNSSTCCQIVSIGAGYDTRVWQLLSNNSNIRYIEIDFSQVMRHKTSIIQNTTQLSSMLNNVKYTSDKDGILLSSDHYIILEGDLREEESLKHLVNVIDSKLPTLFISEMVLVYMDPQYSDQLISTCRDSIDSNVMSVFIIYETINPHDSFGRMMVQNLKNRGCDLKSIEAYPTLESMKKRMESLFLYNNTRTSEDQKSFAVSFDYYSIYNTILPKQDSKWIQERSRISRLEMVDELEEFDLLMKHYALTIAVNNFPTTAASDQSYWLSKML
jgi:O-methyltransferase involved in polyketide biosynthesis